MNTEELLKLITHVFEERKAQSVSVLDVKEKTSVADYMVVATGRSSTNVRSLAENLEESLEKEGVVALRKEGMRDGRWTVVDYGDVIVHIMDEATRQNYNLEGLWAYNRKEQ